jgi:ABC-2 type transport system ATP-binding protein
MRRRLDLAASMIAAPPVMFLDEPTTGLDPVSRAQIWQAIREMVTQSGTSVLLTSQYLEEAEQLADDVTVINDGIVAASGTPRQLRESVGQANVRVVLRDADSSAASRLGALLGPTARIDGRVVTLAAPDGLGSLADVVARLHPMAAEVDDVALQRPSLEEAFTILTAAGPSEDGAQPELAIAGAR